MNKSLILPFLSKSKSVEKVQKRFYNRQRFYKCFYTKFVNKDNRLLISNITIH